MGGANELLKSLSIPEIYDYMNGPSQRAEVLILGGPGGRKSRIVLTHWLVQK